MHTSRNHRVVLKRRDVELADVQHRVHALHGRWKRRCRAANGERPAVLRHCRRLTDDMSAADQQEGGNGSDAGNSSTKSRHSWDSLSQAVSEYQLNEAERVDTV